MAGTDSYAEYVMELLEKVGPIQGRRMFGGWGFYFEGKMFAIISQGQLFLKVDDITKPEFEAAGCKPFIYEGKERHVQMAYWTPPSDASDDAYEMLPWARRAIDASRRAALKKAPKKQPREKKPPVAKKAPTKKKAPVAKKAPAKKKPSVAKKAPAAKKAARLKRS
ncbi:TfoX domain-containing protein [Myxococcus stipitatus DSM 14675]|uniref:TfoX domain-containing protein n=1 Tax=Myxococcus stipitatus (strain DSM 14675 / JCM 12634 / Mx s8) TaxID=1278073 RepID=L7U2N3_MYXSD|nr:TfoX/Sxy family protein [Myxococcus stipitatus]AGC43031.1 TfoX domain-containing protein [Myxococcus stipitatus DSM 14675]